MGLGGPAPGPCLLLHEQLNVIVRRLATAIGANEKGMEQNAFQALQYGQTEGYQPLPEMIARHIARYGIRAKTENVLITTGSQQALDLIGKLLINPGDRILVEAPTYLGALQAFNLYGAEYLSIPCDQLAQTTFGKILLLHLPPANVIAQSVGLAIVLCSVWIHSGRSIGLGVSMVLVGHIWGWHKVNQAL